MALGDRRVHVLPVLPAVAGERGDRPLALIEQRPDLRAIIAIAGRQLGRGDRAGRRVHAECSFARSDGSSCRASRSAMRRGRPA